MGGGERRGLSGGQGRNEKERGKKKPAVRSCRIVHAQPFNLLSAFSCRGENVTLAYGQIRHKIKTNTQQ